jgi:hypothetical protein
VATAPGIIEQQITAGNQFTGSAGAGTPVDADGIRTFPPANQGGLFELDFAEQDGSFETYIIDQILADFGDAATAVVNIITAPARTTQLAAPGAGMYLFTGPLELAWDQKIQVVTTGASVALWARVHARPGRVRPAS